MPPALSDTRPPRPAETSLPFWLFPDPISFSDPLAQGYVLSHANVLNQYSYADRNAQGFELSSLLQVCFSFDEISPSKAFFFDVPFYPLLALSLICC